MKRPLVPVALLYTGGILLGDYYSLPLRWLVVVSLLIGATGIFWKTMRPFLLPVLLVMTGMFNMQLHTKVLSPHDLREIFGPHQEITTLVGTLTETPYERIYEADENISTRTIAFIECRRVLLQATNWQPVVGRIMVSTAGLLPANLFAGQTVEITGFIHPPKGAAAQGLFDYRAYLRRQGIHYQLHVQSSNDWRLVGAPISTPLADRFRAWAKTTLANGLPEIDEPVRLLWAMTLGWKTALSGEVAEPFMRSGTMHVFAISGLHIALIALILVQLLRLFGISRALCGIIVIPAIWFYTGVTGWQASAIRSTIMSTIIIAGWSLNRPSDLLNSLAAAGLLILVWDPQQLFQASFQLSFFVVLSLALLCPKLIALRDGLLRHDSLLPTELVPVWRRRWVWIARHSSSAFITSLAAWIGSVPIIAYYFHLFTPGSLFANLLVVPASSLALMSNLGSLLIGAWLPAVAELLNHAAWGCMVAMVAISKWFAALPGFCFYFPSPGLLVFVAYYALVLSLFFPLPQHPRWRPWTTAGASVILVLALFVPHFHPTATRITIFPLKGGEAIFIDPAGSGPHTLIDCGDEETVQFVTQPFLRAQGLNTLHRMWLTHGDARHVGGAATIHAGFSVPEICISPVRARSKIYRDLHGLFESIPGLTRTVKAGDHLQGWNVLYPALTNRFPRADDNALVLSANLNGAKIIFLSDLGRAGQISMASGTASLEADIVIAGIPQQDEPLADGLLELLQPKLVIVADSEFPAWAQASKSTKRRLADRSFPIIYTSQTGPLTLTLRKNKWQIAGMSGLNFSFFPAR